LINFLYISLQLLQVDLYFQSNLCVGLYSSGIMILLCDLIGGRGILHGCLISYLSFFSLYKVALFENVLVFSLRSSHLNIIIYACKKVMYVLLSDYV
jgi:hypothetical protein